MELKDTIQQMLSEDYKDRFKAEYYQVKIRYDKLVDMLDRRDKGQLSFPPTCPRELLWRQVTVMEDYMDLLIKRSIAEGIDLSMVRFAHNIA